MLSDTLLSDELKPLSPLRRAHFRSGVRYRLTQVVACARQWQDPRPQGGPIPMAPES